MQLPTTAATAALALLLALSGGCSTLAYLAEQGRGQLHILATRRRISEVLVDPDVSLDVKARLRLAVRAREFGVRSLGLRGGDAYTRYLDTGDDPIAWSVYAAYPDQLKPYLHRFPIAGAVPYLGFFDKRSAEREKAKLDGQGLDTFLVPIAGYSTLGYTADPIYSSMIEGTPARIVEVVLHEMLHGTVYRPGYSEWNESLATLVGFEGAAAFFASPEGRAEPLDAIEGGGSGADPIQEVREEAREREQHEQEFADFLAPVVRDLKALYARPISKQEKLALREPIFDRAMEQYRARFPPRPRKGETPEEAKKPRAIERQRLNNAVVLSLTTYHQSTPALRTQLAACGGDLRNFIAAIKRQYGD